ncbi:MAG: VPLPA-CTERM sorting domain-containing protein [Albidovulum sp.]
MLRTFLITAAAALTIGQAAGAATVSYSNLASYNAAVGGSNIVETFTGNTINSTEITAIQGAGVISNNRLQRVAGNLQGSQSTTLVFSTAMTSFAATIGNLGQFEMANVFLDGVLAGSISGGSNFFGIHSTTHFTTITFVDATLPTLNTQFNLDNIRLAAVPLAAGLPLMLTGLGALFGIRRRRRAA